MPALSFARSNSSRSSRESRDYLSIALAIALAGGLLLVGSSAQSSSDAAKIALDHVRGLASGMRAGDVAKLLVSSEYTDAHSGVTHVYVAQSIAGIEVHNSGVAVGVDRDGNPHSVASRLESGIWQRANSRVPGISAATAVEKAADALGLTLAKPLRVVSATSSASQASVLSDGGISSGKIPAKLVYLPIGNEVGSELGSELRLAWNVSIHETDGSHWWTLYVDAISGELLSQNDYVVNDGWVASGGSFSGVSAPLAEAATSGDGSNYFVFPIPIESPNHGGQASVSEPADATASPFGWHDIDGLAGPEFTDTRGNNVYAQEDADADNAGGFRPSGGPTLDFFYPFDRDLAPTDGTNLEAAIANLFYWNNIVHDVAYQYGFTEAAGNFQQDNYGRGGVAGDPVQADAQDSGLNNASFATPPDGEEPRMQMFIWRNPFENNLTITSPGPIARDYGASDARFGPDFTLEGVTGEIVLVEDGVEDSNDACEPLTNGEAIAGNIALIHRADCLFVTPVRNAQNAGASAVVFSNNVVGPPVTVRGSDQTIVIPSGMISKSDGALIEGALGPVVGNMHSASLVPNRDSDLDNAIIAHEFGHGISNRLTGGPDNTSCLFNKEQMGEGWSDFIALALTTAPGSTGADRRGVATYLRFQATDGIGIRLVPYSTDTNINPYTYDDRTHEDLSDSKGVGLLWASMLWDMYWLLVDQHGFNPDVYGGYATGGNNLAIQLVFDGLKLQPCSPGFVDGRDAIVLADELLTGGANECTIWRAFAARGLGADASQGSSDSIIDGAADFSLPPQCQEGIRFEYLLWQDGNFSVGSFLLDENSFTDHNGETGAWFQSGNRFFMIYFGGVECDAVFVGDLQEPQRDTIQGLKLCRDGSQDFGIWIGNATGAN